MSELNIPDLKAAALAAKPIEAANELLECDHCIEKFHALANPTTILALIERLQVAEDATKADQHQQSAVECYLAKDGEHMQHPTYGGGCFFTDDCLTTAFLAPPSETLTVDEIINIANERHIAMRLDADDQEEMLAIVHDCFDSIAARRMTP